ncbi:MAG TPA: tRNA pseudouridine(55) synthase TruB [Pyrinomonadaceae bacterium]|nr:tRNA pseudouridine(55) synthase TruB [Pyrinomonadaceae bacterium]
MDGVLIIDKPAGITSHDVVARVRRIIGERRVGHTGTLDPFATGVLVMLVGRATRLARFLSGAEKEYEAVIRLGYATDTGDVTGARLGSPSAHAERSPEGEVGNAHSHPQSRGEGSIPDVAKIAAAMALLTGEIEQVPPMYSAKKIAGRKLYEHARRGEEIERQPVRVTISEFELLTPDARWKSDQDGAVDLRARVVCSAGTYIRTLAEDLGKRLGLGAHLAELRRTRAGRFTIENALTLEEMVERSGSLAQALISPGDTLSHLPLIELDEEQARRTVHGIDLLLADDETQSWVQGDSIRLTRRGELIAIGTFDVNSNTLHPAVVIKTE